MRVLLVSDFYPPHLGGVELQVQALAQGLSAMGHEVVVATLWQHGQASEGSEAGVRVVRIRSLATMVPWFSGDPGRRYHPPVPDPRVALALRRLARSFRPEVVQTHGWIAYSVALGLAGMGIPLALSVRDYGYACATRNLLIDGRLCSGPALEKCLRHATNVYGPVKGTGAVLSVLGLRGWLAGRIGFVHAVSGYVADVTRRDLLRRRTDVPVRVIADIVIDPAARTAAARVPDHGGSAQAGPTRSSTRPALPDRPYILFVGALQPHKGLGPLLAAYRMLDAPPPLVLIGTRWPDTPDFPADVTVLTDVAHHDVMAAWQGALFGVAPSIWPDPLPGVIREAMSAGRPVIGTRAGGIPDIIAHEGTGLLVEPGDTVALAGAMRRLLDDDELRERLGASAQDDVTLFGPRDIAERFVVAYREHAPNRAAARPLPAIPRRPAPDRVHITGISGAGKSTLAAILAERLDLPVHHLDDIALDPATGSPRSLTERLALVAEIAEGPRWITDGVQTGWTDELCERADVIVWLDQLAGGAAAQRITRRFIRDAWAAFRRERGRRRFLRIRDYARHGLALVRSMREVRAFDRAPASGPTDAGSRAATETQVAPYRDKLVHCRTAPDVEAFIAGLEPVTRSVAPVPGDSAGIPETTDA